MSALSSLFISQGSRDHAIAMEVGQRLRAEGYTDLFSRLRPRPGHPRRTQLGPRGLSRAIPLFEQNLADAERGPTTKNPRLPQPWPLLPVDGSGHPIPGADPGR
jgi:hypothetical protein